jgi:septum formation protein
MIETAGIYSRSGNAMQPPQIKIILASASPRRLQILEEHGFIVVARPADIAEIRQHHEGVSDYVTRLAREKAEAIVPQIVSGSADVLLAADTIVAYEEHILEKPRDDEDAYRMLRMLSGNAHEVYTGYALLLLSDQRWIIDYAITRVRFRSLTEQQIKDYIATYKPFDKSGSYGIQQVRDIFVQDVQGSYYNVMGLPIEEITMQLVSLFPA